MNNFLYTIANIYVIRNIIICKYTHENHWNFLKSHFHKTVLGHIKYGMTNNNKSLNEYIR